MTESGQLVQLLFQLISTLPSAIFGIYPDGSIFLWSQGAKNLTEIDPAPALGKNFEKLLKIETKDQIPLLTKLLDSQKQISTEFGNLSLILTPLFSTEKKLIGAVGELKDISSEKRLEELKIDFISMVGHELRTPVSIIKGYLDTIIREAKNLSPEQLTYLKRAYSANERQNQTIETLLDTSQLEAGTLLVKNQKLQLLPLATEVIKEFGEEARAKGLALKLIYPHFNLPEVMADASRVREVLRNLVGNALKYTSQGEITIGFSEAGENVVVSVSDSGPGIPPQLQPKIFGKFVRGEHTLTEFTQGTGLGLYLSRKFLELMGGKIWFETRPGQGTTFKFSLRKTTYKAAQHKK